MARVINKFEQRQMQQPSSASGDFSFVGATKKHFEDSEHDTEKKELGVASSIPINANNTDTDDNCDEGSTGFRAKQVVFNQSKKNVARPMRGKATTTQSVASTSTRNESCSADQQSTSLQNSSVNYSFGKLNQSQASIEKTAHSIGKLSVAASGNSALKGAAEYSDEARSAQGASRIFNRGNSLNN